MVDSKFHPCCRRVVSATQRWLDVLTLTQSIRNQCTQSSLNLITWLSSSVSFINFDLEGWRNVL